ncbi:MAG: Ribosomal protein L24 [Microgenomates group bacterium GW2011_GWA1_48_10]|uniref:Large ribosomal subunit protein uL24 n=1 Tax=Candidatus Gottesmanbacteria bacterium RIFCSPHIGHO2_01_FULL_47_48 TaxID=1798381 RepID=A0A1F6A2J1_9BACT|nr:MAG: Ribosomal protein L24 [Microgenomates group bacterium GW2011_GWA1_48_10]OGG18870.1 MAG: 50S ribosomal protein L24 [Candidatus Gottesmanbacteria bacterium RIFCSPHIGHO2_01_FULL_47_48]
MKLKKNDKVKIMVGKDRGKEGTIEKVWPRENRITVPGVNLHKRHTKPRAQGQKGQIVEFVRPLPAQNVALICPKCKQPTRIGYKLVKDGKVRICRKCHQEI